MSEVEDTLFTPEFNRSVKIRVRDQRLSSEGGTLLMREADHRLGITDSLAAAMRDPRRPDRTRYTLAELLRERLYSIGQGCGRSDDVDVLAHDPALRLAVWDRPGTHALTERLASQPTQSRLTDIIAGDKHNLEQLRHALAQSIAVHQRAAGRDHAVMRATLDIDSLPLEVHGEQAGAGYHGYYKKTMYHPLVASFAPDGDYDSPRLGRGFVHAVLRGGTKDTAAGAPRFIRTALERASDMAVTFDVRMDAGFTEGWIMDPLQDERIPFVGRLKSNARLKRMADPYLYRPVGRPPAEGYERVVDLGTYQADGWRRAYRLILVVIDRPDPRTGQLELFPNCFFLITNWKKSERSDLELLEHYRRRGTFEDRFGEFLKATGVRLSSPRFEENEVEFLLALLSYNMVSVLREEMEAATGSGWDMGRLQRSVLKTAVRITKGARRLFVDVASAARPLWEQLVCRIGRWCFPAAWTPPRGPRRRPWVAPPAHAHLQLVLRE